MAKFIILVGSIKTTEKVVRPGEKDLHISKLRSVGEEIDLDPAEAARINKKGNILEPLAVHVAKAKAKGASKAAIEKAEKEAAELAELEQLEAEEKAEEKAEKSKKTEGGGK